MIKNSCGKIFYHIPFFRPSEAHSACYGTAIGQGGETLRQEGFLERRNFPLITSRHALENGKLKL